MMELTIIEHEGTLVADSREVAAMVGKRHDHLVRDIQGYIEVAGQLNFEVASEPKIGLASQSNFGLADFFIESTYQDAQGKPRPCYLLTKKGCDMVANKMTGAKGVLFTATYIDRFYEMEKKLQQPVALSTVQVGILQKKAAFFDQMVEEKLYRPLREMLPLLSVSGPVFCTFLKRNGLAEHGDNNEMRASPESINDGLLLNREVVGEKGQHLCNEILTTPKGRETFRLLLNK